MARKSGLTIAINGDASGFSRALRNVRRSIRGFTKSFAGQLAGVFAVQKVAGFFSGMIDGFAKIEEASQRLGVSIERTQMLEYAARQTGFGIDALRSAMNKLTKTAGEAATGNKQAAETFALLGIEVDDLRNLTPDQMLDKVAKALKVMNDPLERAALQTKLFGKSGLELNEFLRNYIKLGDDAKKSGLIVDEKTVKAAADFSDAITALVTGLKALVAQTPYLRTVLEYWTGIVNGGLEQRKAESNPRYVSREQAWKNAYEKLFASGALGKKRNVNDVELVEGIAAGGAILPTGGEKLQKRAANLVKMINAELAAQGLGDLQASYGKLADATWYEPWKWGARYSVAPAGALRKMTAEEKKAAEDEARILQIQQELEDEELRRRQKEAREAAAREARQKAIDSVIGGAENAATDARLRAVSPALAEYTAALRKLADLGVTLLPQEDERLRMAIAQKDALATKDEIVKETAAPRYVEAAVRGSMEDYKLRTSAGGDIPAKQLQVAQNQAKDVKSIADNLKKMAAQQAAGGGASLAVGVI